MAVDHRLLHAGLAQPFKAVVDERPSGNFDKRLWTVIGQGAHAHTKARRKDHGMAADGFGHSVKFRSYQRLENRKIRMLQIALEIARHAGNMIEIDGLAVALGKARENTKYFCGALGAEDCKDAGKFAGVKWPVAERSPQ